MCGIIATSAGNDLYHPIQAMLIGAIILVICYKLHYWVERRFKIDDAVGAVAVHGYGGFLGVVVAGFMLWGQPSSPYEGFAHINPLGNFAGAVIDVHARLHPDLHRLQDHRQHGPVARAGESRARGCRLCASTSAFLASVARSGQCRKGDDQIEIREERENVDQWNDKLGR